MNVKRMTRVLAALACAGAVGTASAQATRTWVSGVGDDVNPCSRTAPCKTWAGAISKTAAGGEINALDPGGYGTLTITKSITVDGGAGNIASTLASSVNGFVINAPGARVVLRNLSINGAGTTLGLNGVRFLDGASLSLDNVTIENFSQEGIRFAPTTGVAQLALRDVRVVRTSFGLMVAPGAGAFADVNVERSAFLYSTSAGIRVDDRTSIVVTDSTLHRNGTVGFNAVSAAAGNLIDVALRRVTASSNGVNGIVAQSNAGGGSVAMTLTDSTSAQNGGDGVTALRTAVIRMGNNVVSGNGGIGINPSSGGSILSQGNNTNVGNATNGGPSGAYTPQ